MEISRRGLIISGAAIVAAPAIVRASSLMTVRQWDLDTIAIYDESGRVWSLPDGLRIREYPLGGFGFDVPPGRGYLFARHQATGAKLVLRPGRNDKSSRIGWLPTDHSAVRMYQPRATWVPDAPRALWSDKA